MKSLDQLLQTVTWGGLTEEEIQYVVCRIKESSPGNDEDLYTLLHILGKSGRTKYRKLVEGFLYYPSHPTISSIALRTLCRYWNYPKDYLKELKAFIKGVEWDPDEDIRLIAISCSGAFLREEKDKELLQLLTNVLENDHDNEIAQDVAYEALARALGKEWDEILNTPPDPVSVLAQAHQLCEGL